MSIIQPGGMTRRGFLAGTGAAAWGAHCRLAAQDTPPPNIVYVFSDEHRHQSMSFTEMPELKTPNMARMASEGFSFRQCISNYPVCSPYRAMLLTGRWPYQNNVIDNGIPLPSDQMTVGKFFQQAGYETGYIGKWHLGGTRAEAFGFDTSLIWTKENQHWNLGQYHPATGEPVQPKGYNATLMTDQALEFIGKQRTRPFFLMLSLHPPHANFLDAPDDKKALYPEGSLPRRPNHADSSVKPGEKAFNFDSDNYRGYHAHISAVDDELGRLMASLDQLGLAKNTILLYSSDHGSMQGSHGLGGKRQCFEESLRVPFLAYAPGRVRPAASDALFSTIDIMPTLCGLAGLKPPAACSGQDFSAALLGTGSCPEPESQFIMHIRKENASGGENHPAPLFRGVRTKRHTYATGPKNYECLYDNERDPYQMKNLAEDPSMGSERARLRTMLAAWLVKAQDSYRL